jgi:mannose-6-phosphate isomerase-like protein (cupin superfamily)
VPVNPVNPVDRTGQPVHHRRMVNVIDHYTSGGTVPVIAAPPVPTHEVGSTRFTTLASPSRGSARTSVWQVELPVGEQPTPHELTDEEIFVVLAGTASVEIDGVAAGAGPGDAIVVPAGVRFALANGGDTNLRLLCCFPVGGQALLPDGEPFTPPWAL